MAKNNHELVLDIIKTRVASEGTFAEEKKVEAALKGRQKVFADRLDEIRGVIATQLKDLSSKLKSANYGSVVIDVDGFDYHFDVSAATQHLVTWQFNNPKSGVPNGPRSTVSYLVEPNINRTDGTLVCAIEQASDSVPSLSSFARHPVSKFEELDLQQQLTDIVMRLCY